MKTVSRKKFIKDVAVLPKDYRRKVLAIIEEIETANAIGDISNVEKLSGHKDCYKIRVGYLRIGIHYDSKDQTIYLARCMKRGDMYKHFP